MLERKAFKKVLEALKPLAAQTHFGTVDVDEKQPKNARMLMDFMNGSTVKMVSFNMMSEFEKKSKKAKAVDL